MIYEGHIVVLYVHKVRVHPKFHHIYTAQESERKKIRVYSAVKKNESILFPVTCSANIAVLYVHEVSLHSKFLPLLHNTGI